MRVFSFGCVCGGGGGAGGEGDGGGGGIYHLGASISMPPNRIKLSNLQIQLIIRFLPGDDVEVKVEVRFTVR